MRKLFTVALALVLLIGVLAVPAAFATPPDHAAVDVENSELYLPNEIAEEAADNPIHVGGH